MLTILYTSNIIRMIKSHNVQTGMLYLHERTRQGLSKLNIYKKKKKFKIVNLECFPRKRALRKKKKTST